MKIHLLQWSLIFFLITASIGLLMITRFYRGLPRRNITMLIHGIFAAAAVGVLFYYSALEFNSEVPYGSIFFFIIAIFGGILMAMWDKIMNRKLPRFFPLFHAGAAVTGVVLLVVFMLRHHMGF